MSRDNKNNLPGRQDDLDSDLSGDETPSTQEYNPSERKNITQYHSSESTIPYTPEPSIQELEEKDLGSILPTPTNNTQEIDLSDYSLPSSFSSTPSSYEYDFKTNTTSSSEESSRDSLDDAIQLQSLSRNSTDSSLASTVILSPRSNLGNINPAMSRRGAMPFAQTIGRKRRVDEKDEKKGSGNEIQSTRNSEADSDSKPGNQPKTKSAKRHRSNAGNDKGPMQ